MKKENMRSKSAVERLVATAWLLLTMGAGTTLAVALLDQHRAAAEAMFPLYLVLWLAVFFLGRSVLRRCVCPVSPSAVTAPASQRLDEPAADVADVILPSGCAGSRSRKGAVSPLIFDFGEEENTTELVWPSPILPVSVGEQGYRSRMRVGQRTRELLPALRLSELKDPKTRWTAFEVPSAGNVLQGVVTPTDAGNSLERADVTLLLNYLLEHVFNSDEAQLMLSRSKR